MVFISSDRSSKNVVRHLDWKGAFFVKSTKCPFSGMLRKPDYAQYQVFCQFQMF